MSIFLAECKDTHTKTIRSAIEKIRFLTLTPQQFAEGPARSNLLTESEAFAVLMNILSSNSDVPMPKGFSTCRVPRKQLIGGGPSCNVSEFCYHFLQHTEINVKSTYNKEI